MTQISKMSILGSIMDELWTLDIQFPTKKHGLGSSKSRDLAEST